MKLETLEEGISLLHELEFLRRLKGQMDAEYAGLSLRQGDECYFLINTPGLKERFYDAVMEEMKDVKDKIAAL